MLTFFQKLAEEICASLDANALTLGLDPTTAAENYLQLQEVVDSHIFRHVVDLHAAHRAKSADAQAAAELPPTVKRVFGILGRSLPPDDPRRGRRLPLDEPVNETLPPPFAQRLQEQEAAQRPEQQPAPHHEATPTQVAAATQQQGAGTNQTAAAPSKPTDEHTA